MTTINRRPTGNAGLDATGDTATSAANTTSRSAKADPSTSNERVQDRFEQGGAKASSRVARPRGDAATGDKGVVPNVEELEDGISRHTRLSKTQNRALRRLGPDERRIYGLAIAELDALKAGRINAAEFQANVMDHAARIAGKDGAKFADLAGMCFNAGDMGLVMNGIRAVAGNRWNPAGSAIEEAYSSARGLSANEGYNPMVLDNEFQGDTVTHHYGAFFDVAANRSEIGSHILARIQDAPDTNPGDLRNGRFAAMLGGGVSSGRISPRDAAKLHRWAFNDGQAAPPPWGNDPEKANDGNHFTSIADFRLRNWVTAYNEAHPNNPIALENDERISDLPVMP